MTNKQVDLKYHRDAFCYCGDPDNCMLVKRSTACCYRQVEKAHRGWMYRAMVWVRQLLGI